MGEVTTAGLNEALDRAVKLLAASPGLAERQALEIIKVVPTDPRARLILGTARRLRGDLAGAREVLEPLALSQPSSAQTHYELGLTLAALDQPSAAIGALRHAVSLKRDMPECWRALGDQLTLAGDTAGADAAYAEQIRASVVDPTLRAAADALCDDRLAVAERLLRDHLRAYPTDVAAMRMLAETGTRLGRYGDAEALLNRCLELAPSFEGARYNLAVVLYRQQKGAAAVAHLEQLLAQDTEEPNYRNLMAASLGLIGEYERAIAIYSRLVDERPAQPRLWLNYGHALRTVGRLEDAVTAYNRCLALAPSLGDAYWSLANLKAVPFSAQEEAAMGAQLARPDLRDEDRLHLEYAMGKALEDRGDHAGAFAHYARGAALKAAQLKYDADETTGRLKASRAMFTPKFFADRACGGSASSAPIFILGLPRSGSTLVEQILASHSAIEGTMELPEITAMARVLRGPGREERGLPYPELLADLDPETRTALGEEYLKRAGVHRKLGRPFFIDKMPNNVHHIGLIQLILPNATIIDARRHPMAACFSAFKQLFARGHAFSYDLNDLGRYYCDYVEMMAHFDEVLPGRIHRVIYEDMVGDTEANVRQLLEHCGLEFEPACLRFYENDRAVRTASSEQVRQPIYRTGLDQWQSFETWLGPLKTALGPVLDNWR